MSLPGASFSINMSVLGKPITNALSLDVTLRAGQTMDWALQLADDDRAMDPDGSGEWAHVLDDKPWSADGTALVKALSVSGTIDGQAWSFPAMYGDHYGYGLRQGDPDTVYTWGGVGPALPLYREDQSLSTLMATHLQDVVTSTASTYGVSVNVSSLSPNYLVARHQRQASQPIQWISQAIAPTEAQWYESGSQVVFFVPDYQASPFRTYSTSDPVVRSVQVTQSQTRIVNQVIVARADDVGGVVGTVEATSFGRTGYITFSQPVPMASLTWRRLSEVLGVASDMYFYGPQPPPALPIAYAELRGPVPPIQGGSMAYGVQLTFGVSQYAPTGTTSGSLKMEFRGTTNSGVYSDTTTSLVLNDTASQASGIGIHRQTFGPDPQISDASTLQTWGERLLARLAKKQRAFVVEVPFDPFIRPGHTVDVYDAQLGLTRRLYIGSLTHHIGLTWLDRKTTLQGVQYVDP